MRKYNLNRFRILGLFIFVMLLFHSKIKAQQPQRPIIDSVSVLYTNGVPRVALAWHLAAGEVVDGFVVYRQVFNVAGKLDGTFHGVDTLTGDIRYWEDTNTVYTGAKPLERSVKYRLSAFKFAVDEHSELTDSVGTILINNANYDKCAHLLTTQWIPYTGWGQAELKNVEVWEANADGQYIQMLHNAGFSSDANFSFNTPKSKIWLGVKYNHTSGASSSSPIFPLDIHQIAYPTAVHVDSVLTISAGSMVLKGTYEVTSDVKSIAVIQPQNPDNYLNVSDNMNAEFSLQTNFAAGDSFAVILLDECPQVLLQTPAYEPLVLDITAGNSTILQWNPVAYKQSAESLKLITITDGVETEQVLGTDATNFELTEIYTDSKTRCYFIRATSQQTVWQSNVQCIQPITDIKFPNAIAPDAANEADKYFKALASNLTQYELKIFDRTGTLIFETTDVQQAWDGTYGGKPLPAGIYMYIARYTGQNGNEKKMNGWVAIIR